MTSVSKSLRVDQHIIDQIPAKNFSDFVKYALQEKLAKKVWIPNLDIHKHANQEPKKFYERIKNVNYLRHSDHSVRFSLYPVSKDEMIMNKNLYYYVNEKYNKIHDNYIFFNLNFPVNLYWFLTTNSWEYVEKFIIGYVAILYFFDPENKNIIEAQIEPSILKKAIKLFKDPRFAELSELKNLYSNDGSNFGETQKYKRQHNSILIKLLTDIGINPLMFNYMMPWIFKQIFYPCRIGNHIAFDINREYSVKINCAYMRNLYPNDDWEAIILKGTKPDDNLLRAESLSEPFFDWSQTYRMLHGL